MKIAEKKLPKEAIDLIEAPNFAHIATINKNGSIQITPVWIDHEGDKYVLVNTTFGRAKTRNLEKNPEVGLSLVDQKNRITASQLAGKWLRLLRLEQMSTLTRWQTSIWAKKSIRGNLLKKSER